MQLQKLDQSFIGLMDQLSIMYTGLCSKAAQTAYSSYLLKLPDVEAELRDLLNGK